MTERVLDPRRLASAVDEATFLAAVLSAAKRLGWRAYHPYDSRRINRGSGKGFPDLILVRADRLLFLELKRTGERPDRDQIAWLDALAAARRIETGWYQAHEYDALIERLA